MADATAFFKAAVADPGGGEVLAPDEVMTSFREGELLIVESSPKIAQDAGLPAGPDAAGRAGQVSQEVRNQGWDVVAFYAPFHQCGPDRYGIYYYFEPFASIVESISSHSSVAETFAAAWPVVEAAVLTHERFHFAVELGATHAEVSTGAPELYRNRLKSYRTATSLSDAGALEEAMATADEIVYARRRSPQLGEVIASLSVADGYRDYGSYVGAKERQSGQDAILKDLLGSATTGEILGRHVSRPYFNSIPIRWLLPRSMSAHLCELLPQTFPLPVAKVVAHAKRHGADVQRRSKHQAIVVAGKPRPVTISSGWGKEIPRDFIQSFAGLFNLLPGDYCHQVLTGT